MLKQAVAADLPAATQVRSLRLFMTNNRDHLKPLDPMIEAQGMTPDAYMNQFWPALHRNAAFAGHVWAVPFHNSTPLLYINADHFRAAGLNPDAPPATWAELVDAAKKLTVTEGGNTTRYGFMLPGNYDCLGWILSALAMSNGGEYFNPYYGGEVYYDTPSMQGAVQFVDDLIHKHKVTPEGVTDGKAVSTAFFAGQASMVTLSTGSLSFIRENMKGDYRVAFVPRNLRNAVPIGGASLMMPKGLSEEEKAAAWTLITWLTSPEISGHWSRFTGYFAPNMAAYDLPEMKSFLAEHPDAQVAIDQLAFAQPWFATYGTVAVRKALEDEVQAVMSGAKTPADAVKAAQAKADEILAPYVAQTALKLPEQVFAGSLRPAAAARVAGPAVKGCPC